MAQRSWHVRLEQQASDHTAARAISSILAAQAMVASQFVVRAGEIACQSGNSIARMCEVGCHGSHSQTTACGVPHRSVAISVDDTAATHSFGGWPWSG